MNDICFYSSPLTKASARFAHKAYVEKKKHSGVVGDDDDDEEFSEKG